MFRISFVCDDKKLAAALRGLTGIAIGAPEALPVVNAVKQNGKVKADGSGDAIDMFVKHIKTMKTTEFSPADMKNFCKVSGWSPQSASYFSKKLVSAGVIKKVGKGSHVHYVAVK